MLSDNTQQQAEFQMVAANGSTSANGESSRTVTYKNLVANADLFWNTLRDFHGSSGITVEDPTVCGLKIDLHKLFVEVTSRGGLDKVLKDRQCSEVIRRFNPRTISNAALLLKKHYRKMLLEFEKMYFVEEPCLELNANQAFTIDGVIDCKFESGYLITVKMGSEELKGVLYHPSTPTPVETRSP